MSNLRDDVVNIAAELPSMVKSLLDKIGMSQAEALERGLIAKSDLTFTKTGEEIATAAQTAHLQLEAECDKLKAKYPKLGTPEASSFVKYNNSEPQTGFVVAGEESASDAIPSDAYYQYQRIMSKMKDALLIATHIDKKKKYQLDMWQMKQLGFAGPDIY